MKITTHRWLNTSLSLVAVVVLIIACWHGYKFYEDYERSSSHATEMYQISQDEGFNSCAYTDSLGFKTIGFGHLIKDTDSFDKCIDIATAFKLLYEDYSTAMNSVENRYSWADGEVKLVLANMTYQLGGSRLGKFHKTIYYLSTEDYNKAAIEMQDSRWAKQTPKRALRLSVRILALSLQ